MPDPTGGILTAVAPTVVGGLMGGSQDAPTQTSQNQIDPMMAKYIYGENGTGGLLGDLQSLYAGNRSGLNQPMLAGLNQKLNVYQSPLANAGYETMGQTGLNMMRQGVASNPFSSGNMPAFGRLQASQQTQQAPQQAQQAPSFNAGVGLLNTLDPRRDQINAAYQRSLGRDMEPGVFESYYLPQLNNYRSVASFSNEIGASPEAQKYSALPAMAQAAPTAKTQQQKDDEYWAHRMIYGGD